VERFMKKILVLLAVLSFIFSASLVIASDDDDESVANPCTTEEPTSD